MFNKQIENAINKFNGDAKLSLTLGTLIEKLEAVKDKSALVAVSNGVDYQAPGEPHSYRGYYDKLSFAPSDDEITVRDFLKLLKREVLNKTFRGWKGGEFVMDADVDMYFSPSGEMSNEQICWFHQIDNVVLLMTETEEF